MKYINASLKFYFYPYHDMKRDRSNKFIKDINIITIKSKSERANDPFIARPTQAKWKIRRPFKPILDVMCVLQKQGMEGPS